jgi:peptide deformylase
MAILKIARLGHPVLLARAAPVEDPTSPDIARIVADMAETMLDANGLGLAAPQVHLSLRIFVFRQGEDDSPSVAALINPELMPLDEDIETGWEGCLSIPGLRGAVPRARRIWFRALDLQGRTVEGEADGLTARVFQHETDHLDGIVYPMRMPDLSRLGFVEELSRFGAQTP